MVERHRKKLRLEGYDYASNGLYFITIYVKNGECLFGSIVDNRLLLFPAGEMIASYWQKLPLKYPCFSLDDFVVMPNHFHAIVLIDTKIHSPINLSQGIQWFKTVTTNVYIQGVNHQNWTPFMGKLWHRSFYDHIIRDEKGYLTIKSYIALNPEQWIEDKLHPTKFHVD